MIISSFKTVKKYSLKEKKEEFTAYFKMIESSVVKYKHLSFDKKI